MGYNGMENKVLRLLIGDPAKTTDAFGVIGVEATWPARKIYLRFAKRFWNEPYKVVANHFALLKRLYKINMMILEKNFDYENVSKAFAHLPITYVTTTGNMTEEKRAKGWAVDKPYMIGWLKQEYKKHTILYPRLLSVEFQELINQRNEMVGITAPSGHVSYKRQRGRHDDLFMAELIGCNAVRLWWDLQ